MSSQPGTPAGGAHRPPGAGQAFLTVFPSIILPMFLAVVDQTIVATALPAIAASLGEVSRLSWVVVAYLVATTIAAPVYGRLGDMLGRRRLMFVALVIFMAASVLCALSTSLTMLTAARVLQGAGGGGLMTLSQALIGEVLAPRDRARFQGYLAAVAVTSSSFGPVAGGILTENFGWQSVFLVNIPVGLVAMVLTLRLPHRPGTGEPFRFDAMGLVLFAAFISSTLVLLETSQNLFAGEYLATVLLAGVALSAVLLLIAQERRSRSPLLPIPLLRHPSIWRADALAACHGATLVSLVTFLPFYLRMTHGTSATDTGLLLLPLTMGIGIGSLTTGRLVGRTGRTAVFPSVGLTIAAAALALLAFAADAMSAGELAAAFGVISVFMGTVMGVVQLTVQVSAGAQQLGAGAATVQFSRSLGAALGTALVGAVLFVSIAIASPAAADAFGALLQAGPAALEGLSEPERDAIARGLGGAFRNAFLCIAVFAAIAARIAWTLPLRSV